MRKKIVCAVTVGLVVSLFVSLFAFSASAAIPQTELFFWDFTEGDFIIENASTSIDVGSLYLSENTLTTQQQGPYPTTTTFTNIRLKCNIAFPVASNDDIITMAFVGNTTSPQVSSAGVSFRMRLTFEDGKGLQYQVFLDEATHLNTSTTTNLDLIGSFNFPTVIGIITLKQVEFIYNFTSPVQNPNVTINAESWWIKSQASSAQGAIESGTSQVIDAINGGVTNEQISGATGDMDSIINQYEEMEVSVIQPEEMSSYFQHLTEDYTAKFNFASVMAPISNLWQYFLPVGIITLAIFFAFFSVAFFGKRG